MVLFVFQYFTKNFVFWALLGVIKDYVILVASFYLSLIQGPTEFPLQWTPRVGRDSQIKVPE